MTPEEFDDLLSKGSFVPKNMDFIDWSPLDNAIIADIKETIISLTIKNQPELVERFQQLLTDYLKACK
jgi:hypothetical protein